MTIDFTEIPPANKGGNGQDRFEQFACHFLETIGYKILTRPDRGPDRKKDFFVSETRPGIGGETNIKWLVSCKHNARSNKSVKDSDELLIIERLERHGCQGFLGFYSTIPAASLSDMLAGLEKRIEFTIYDGARIERELLVSKQRDLLLTMYFPKSHDKFRQLKLQDSNVGMEQNTQVSASLNEDDVLRITKTAIIMLELEKIKEEYYENSWSKRGNALDKLYRYTDHTNEKVASAVFQFLYSVANQTRSQMPSGIASSLHSLVLTFFPSSYDSERELRIENGKQCVHIGFSLIYDAFIYLNNFSTAAYGLSIWKYIYREGKRNDMQELVEIVKEQYKELDRTLERPERTDLTDAKEFVKIFKDDLETWDMAFPILPEYLHKLTLVGDKE